MVRLVIILVKGLTRSTPYYIDRVLFPLVRGFERYSSSICDCLTQDFHSLVPNLIRLTFCSSFSITYTPFNKILSTKLLTGSMDQDR